MIKVKCVTKFLGQPWETAQSAEGVFDDERTVLVWAINWWLKYSCLDSIEVGQLTKTGFVLDAFAAGRQKFGYLVADYLE